MSQKKCHKYQAYYIGQKIIWRRYDFSSISKKKLFHDFVQESIDCKSRAGIEYLLKIECVSFWSCLIKRICEDLIVSYCFKAELALIT